MISKFFRKTTEEDPFIHRRDTLLAQFDFILDTLENNKFDILYMENLKSTLTNDEKIYFIQQIDRIESAKKILLWMKNNAKNNDSFWKRLLRW